MTNVAALSILLLTVSLSLSRPRLGSFRIHHATAATIGAVLTVATQLIPIQMVWMAFRLLFLPVLTIVSLMIVTLIAEKAGLFRMVAARLAIAAAGDARALFAYLFFCGTLLGTLFTNDAAVLIFTPLVVNLVEQIQEEDWTIRNKIPFYFAVLYVANLVGALIISNPINIIVSSLFDIQFLEYAAWMTVPAIVSVSVSYIGLRLMFRKHLPRTYDLRRVTSASPPDRAFAVSCTVVLVLTLAGFFAEHFTSVPMWLVAAGGAITLMTIYTWRYGASAASIVKGVSWDVVVFVVGIFIVAMGLRNAGLTHVVGAFAADLGGSDLSVLLYVTAFVSGLLSSVMNNHPTADMMSWVIRDFHLSTADTKMLALSSLIGGGLGPKMLPIGSLAALIWFRLLRDRGIDIPYALYIKIGVPVSLAAILLSVVALNAERLLHLWLVG